VAKAKFQAAEHQKALNRIASWRAKPDASIHARLATALLAGETLDRNSPLLAEVNPSNLSQVAMVFKTANYDVILERVTGGTGKQYRLNEPSGPKSHNISRRQPVRREVAGLTHPGIGDVLTVRALLMEDDGALTMQLSNGHGAWLVQVTGHVDKSNTTTNKRGRMF
jgi:hypothetical protein